MTEFLRQTETGTHVTWTVTRPERANGIGPTLAEAFTKALDQLLDRPVKPRALVITAVPVLGATTRIWIAGGDLKELATIETTAAGQRYSAQMSAFLAGLASLPIPVITAIDGAAIGGGAELALAGDLRIATKASRIEFRHMKAMLATGYGTCRRLVDLVGLSRAQWLMLTCAKVEAEEALAQGLVHQVVRGERELEQAIDKLCLELSQLPADSLEAQKQMLWHATESAAEQTRAAELKLFTSLWGRPTHKAFLHGFANKPSESR